MTIKVSGRCLCGAVTFTAEAERPATTACHCDMCQRWSCGPLLVLDCIPGSIEVSGQDSVAAYESSPWATRSFCRTCGSNLFWHSKNGRFEAVSAGALDDKSSLKLGTEIFIDEKPAFYAFLPGAHRMTGPEFMALLGGTPQAD